MTEVYVYKCLGVAEDCLLYALNHTLQCLLVSIVFGMVSSLHLT